MGPDLAGLLALLDILTGAGRGSSRSLNMEPSPSSASSSLLMSSSWTHLLPAICLRETSPAIFLRSSSSSSSRSAKFPAWKALVRKSDIPPRCPNKGMEMGKATPEVDAFGVDAAAGAEEVEVTRMLVGSFLKPGGGAREVWERDTPVTMPAGTETGRLERRLLALASHPKQKYWEDE